jgi:hypothetical protein
MGVVRIQTNADRTVAPTLWLVLNVVRPQWRIDTWHG